jgi:hypothetical protein
MLDTNSGSDNQAGGTTDTFPCTSLAAVVGDVLLAALTGRYHRHG